MTLTRTILAGLACGLLAVAGLADDDDGPAWNQYRGAARDGVVPSVSLTWPESGPRVAWKTAAGSGFSQLAIVGGAVFTGVSDDSDEHVVRLDLATGKEAWRTAIGPLFENNFGNGPRATPTIDGDRVYALGGKGKLVALKAEDGAEVWSVDLGERFGGKEPRFGYAGSPLVVGDLVVIDVGAGEGKAVAAVDKKSGETRWTALDGPTGYSSGIAAEIGGVRQIVLARGKDVTGLDLEGKTLWSHTLEQPAIAMPLAIDDDRVFVSSAGDAGCAMLRVSKGDDGFSVSEVWKNRSMKNHFNSSAYRDGLIYGFDNATLRCISADDGETRWAKRGFGKGSLLVAGGRLVVLSDKGKLLLVDGGPDEYREFGSAQVLEGKSWTAPSYGGGKVCVRNLAEMACVELGG